MPTSDNSAALARLKAAITTVAIIAFWRRYKRHFSPLIDGALEVLSPLTPTPLRSLSRRWSANRLQTHLTEAANNNPATPHEAEKNLSETWSPASLTKFLSAFRSKPASPKPPPTYSFTSWCEFMEDSLHHPAWGYYSDGRVAFGESSESDDFTTFPVSMRPTFGAMLADRLMTLSNAIDETEDCFIIVELGAGTGVLAHDVLSHLETAAPTLYARVRYVIGERSPSLRLLQEATNKRFVAESKLHIVPADARDLKGCALRETLIEIAKGSGKAKHPVVLRGAIVSNELPDAFGVERVLVGATSVRDGAASFDASTISEDSELYLGGDEATPPASVENSPSVALPRSPANSSMARPRPPPLPSPILRRSTSSGEDSASSLTKGLRLQRGVVLPLIRASDLSRLIMASDEPVPSTLSSASLTANSRAARGALCAGIRDGTWELGCGGAHLLPAADEALREWLHVPPKPPPVRLKSPSLRSSPLLPSSWFSWSGNVKSPGSSGGSSGGGDTVNGGGSSSSASGPTAQPAEWIHLPREAYCALKGRCCRSTNKIDNGALDPNAVAPSFGTPLEVAFDSAVVICEAFELISATLKSSTPHGEGKKQVTFAEHARSSGVGELLRGGGFGSAALRKRRSNAPAATPTRRTDDSHAALLRWLNLHAPLLRAVLRKRPPGERLELYPSPALPTLAAGLASLLDEGAVVTIDYGADAATLINSAKRVAPKLGSTPPAFSAAAAALRSSAGMRVRSRLPCEKGKGATLAFSRPGWSDLTTDVNFTELAAVGESHGMRTVFFGPQTGLQRCFAETDDAPAPPLVTNATPAHNRNLLDAFYSLGSFVMLVQATPNIADKWSFGQASQPLFEAGQPSLGAMALVHTLRTLGRIVLEHALRLPQPSERELTASLADALIPSVPCFKAMWRPMMKEVLRLLKGEDEAVPASLPPLYAPALEMVKQDLATMRAVIDVPAMV